MSLRLKPLSIATLILACAAMPVSAQSVRSSSAQIWLAEHNRARADFGSAPLVWSEDLAREAKGWARRLAGEGRLRHSSNSQRGGRGENLWMGSRGYYRPQQMIASFTNEKRHFKAGQFPSVSRTGNWADVGHYTQIVWPETREVGCALAAGRRFDVLVCRYWPSGNVYGASLAPKRVARRR